MANDPLVQMIDEARLVDNARIYPKTCPCGETRMAYQGLTIDRTWYCDDNCPAVKRVRAVGRRYSVLLDTLAHRFVSITSVPDQRFRDALWHEYERRHTRLEARSRREERRV